MGVSDVDAQGLMHHYAAVCGVGLTVGYQMLHSYGWRLCEWAASRDINRLSAIRTTSGQPRHDVTAMLIWVARGSIRNTVERFRCKD